MFFSLYCDSSFLQKEDFALLRGLIEGVAFCHRLLWAFFNKKFCHLSGSSVDITANVTVVTDKGRIRLRILVGKTHETIPFSGCEMQHH